MEQRPDESAEAEVRDLNAKLPATTPADLAAGRLRPAALVRWGFFVGVGLLLAYGAARALLSVRNLLILILAAMFLAVSLDPGVRWLVARGLAVALIMAVLGAILAAFLVSVIPHLVGQFTTLVQTLPGDLAKLADRSRAIRTSTPATSSASGWKAWSPGCPSGWPVGRSGSPAGSSGA